MNITELPGFEKEADANMWAGIETDEAAAKQVEVLIHTRHALDESAAEQVIQKLDHVTGVFEASYNPARNHLLMVSYEPRRIKPLQLLSAMRELGHEAQLVGL